MRTLTQEILLKVWKSIENFEYDPEKCRFRSWLSKVCRNKVYDFFDSQKRKIHSDSNEMPAIPNGADIDSIIEVEWKLYISSKAFEIIEKRFDEKTVKAYYLTSEGKATEEIAKELEISESTVYVYNKRVKDALSREILILRQDLE